MAAAHAIPDGCAYPAQRRRLAEDASPAPPVPGREGRRWRVHAAVAGGAAAALFALSCTVALGAPFSARPRQHGTQLLQWFGLAQGTLNEGRAPDAGNVMARTLGMREGTIPKGAVVDYRASQMPLALQNPHLSAAAMARAMGTSLHPLLDENGDGDEKADRSDGEPAPAWVREDLGETSQRQVHREQAAATAAFIEHQRAIAQTRWALALGLEHAKEDEDAKGSAGSRVSSPQVVGSVDLRQAPAWVRKDYEPEAPLPKQAAEEAAAADTVGGRQDAAALADEAELNARLVSAAEAQLVERRGGAAVQTLASAPPRLDGGDGAGLLRARAQALVKSQEATERATEEKSAEEELLEIEKESKIWTTHLLDSKTHARSALITKARRHATAAASEGRSIETLHELKAAKAKLGLSVNQDATLPPAPSGPNALREQQQQQLELREEERNWGAGGEGTLEDLATRTVEENFPKGSALGSARVEALMSSSDMSSSDMSSAARSDMSRAASSRTASSTLESPARLQMLSDSEAVPMASSAARSRAARNVAGMQSILDDLRRLKMQDTPAEAEQKKEAAVAAQQQGLLLRLAGAEHGRSGVGESSALLKRLQKQLFAPLPSAPLPSARLPKLFAPHPKLPKSTAASYRQAGEVEEEEHLHELVSAVSPPLPALAPRGVVHATAPAAGAEAARERAGDVQQRQEDVKMAAIDRLYKRLYGHNGAFLGAHSSPTSRGYAAQQEYASVPSVPQELRGRSGGPGGGVSLLSPSPSTSLSGGVSSQSLSATQVQQLAASDGGAALRVDAASAAAADVGGVVTREEKISAERAELQKAEATASRSWEGEPYGENGAETEGNEHEKMVKQHNFVSSVLEHMEHKAYLDGIETQNDVDTIHRLQKAYPYNVRDISKKWAMCAKNAVDLSRGDRETCADHFVWLMLKRSINQAYCDPQKKAERDCAPTKKVRNPGFDVCLNPMLNDIQMHDCLLRITQVVQSP